MALDYNIIGERLKKARSSKGLTQEKLAEKLDVSIAFLSRIERGSSHISLKRLSQICDILKISEGSILNGSSSNSTTYLSSEFENFPLITTLSIAPDFSIMSRNLLGL